MVRRNFFCPICGVVIEPVTVDALGEETALEWYQMLRVVRRHAFWAPATISGIGYLDPNERVLATPEPEASITDRHAQREEYVKFLDIDGHWSFILHAGCWDIILQKIPRTESSVTRICTTLHAILYCSVWKGTCIEDSEHGFEGAAHFQRQFDSPVADIIRSKHAYLLVNPSHLLGVESLFLPGREHDSFPCTISVPSTIGADSDRFSTLTTEMIHHIASYLSSKSVGDLRLASPWVAAKTCVMSLPQGFWWSRFCPGFEMNFALPILTGPVSNWCRAYFAIKAALHLPENWGLKNRRRIWNLISKHAGLLQHHTVESGILVRGAFYPGDSNTLPRVQRHSTKFITTEEKTDQYTYNLLVSGGRTIREMELALPTGNGEIDRAEVFLVTFGSREYIAGLRFTLTDTYTGQEQTRLLGYTGQKKQPFVMFPSSQDVVGFGVAICAGGIVGLRLLLRRGTLTCWTRWIGNTESKEAHISYAHLVPERPVEELHVLAAFDAFKMVGMGIDDSPSCSPPSQPPQLEPIWTPCPPRAGPRLLPGLQALSSQVFNRFLNIEFGGERGERLAHLSRVVAHISKPQCPILGLSFYFVGLEPLHFGRQGMIEMSFLIDGPKGERIQGVAYDRRSDVVVALRMLTNFGGDITFVANRLIGPYNADCPHPDDPDWQDKLDHMSNVLRAPRGEVIVGFTSVLEDAGDSFQTFGLQCETANAVELHQPQLLGTDKHQMPKLEGKRIDDISDYVERRCCDYTTASLDGIVRIRFSCGQDGRPRRSDEISGLWLEYSAARPVILGQWITEVGTITLPENEPITEIRLWLRGATRFFNYSRPVGRVMQIGISTHTQSFVWPPTRPSDEGGIVCLTFQSSYLEKLSLLMWVMIDTWDLIFPIMAPLSRARHLTCWSGGLFRETKYPWEEPHKVLWTLGNGTDRLISITPFQSRSMWKGISGLRFTYESGRTINAGTATTGEPTLPGITFEKEDRLYKVVIRKGIEDFVDIYFSFKNAKTGQVTTQSFDNYKNFQDLVYDSEISRYMIDIDQRHYNFDDGWKTLHTLPSQIPDGEVVGLCVSDVQMDLNVGLVLLQENPV